jgi:hypothetical protein
MKHFLVCRVCRLFDFYLQYNIAQFISFLYGYTWLITDHFQSKSSVINAQGHRAKLLLYHD